MSRYFLITPFGTKKTQKGKKIDFTRVQKELVEPAAKNAGLEGGTTGIVIDSGSIHEDMFQLIIESDVVICDVTLHNANVWYELGIRHALRRKNTVLIKGNPCDDTPFDILTYRYAKYDAADPAKSVEELAKILKANISAERETDSPVFKMLPKLEQPDPEAIQVVPADFAEDVERARAAHAEGWLRLLSEEVMGLRFQRPGLRLIGAAQLEIEDYEGAGKTWAKVQEQIQDDVEANLALANIHERVFRQTQNPVDLTNSDLAINRVLKNESLPAGMRAEALAFLGRNLKTRWRMEFEGTADLAERRRLATNRNMIDSYNAYRDAFLVDLNHFWSGLAALQMNAIARDLAQDAAWKNSFRDPKGVLKKMERESQDFTPIVAQGIRNALVRKGKGDEWADISEADLGFVTSDPEALLRNLYRGAIDKDGFKFNSAIGQLELFQSIGFRADDAASIIAELKQRFGKKPEKRKDRYVVVVAGHQIDDADRSKSRFPESAEASARQKLSAIIQDINSDDADVTILASAASGTDLICHEVCNELKLTSTICLPIPPVAFAEKCFSGLGNWRNRFLQLAEDGKQRLRILSNSEGLPNWLHKNDQDPWRRGNHWVIEMARAIPAKRYILVVLWDGKRDDAGGGASHAVALAEKRGFQIKEISTKTLEKGNGSE